MMVLFEYELRWIFRNLYAEAVWFRWRMGRKLGSLSSTRGCQICVTSAATSHTMTETVSYGLRVVAHYHLKLNSMVHGSEHYFLCDKKNKNKKLSFYS